MVKYNAKWEITNTYENLQIDWSQFFTDKLIFFYIRSNWNIYWLSIFGFFANEYKQIAIQIHSTIHNIWSAIWWAIMKVILNYSLLPSWYKLMLPKCQWRRKKVLVQLSSGRVSCSSTGSCSPILGPYSRSNVAISTNTGKLVQGSLIEGKGSVQLYDGV